MPTTFKKNENTFYAVIESVKGSNIKYKYIPKNDFFYLERLLPAGTVFPFDFGFIPHTICADNDPLDVIVLLEYPTFTGCVLECRCIGVMEIEQREAGRKKKYRNDRIIAAAAASHLFSQLTDVNELNETVINEMICFFKYASHFAGKSFELLGVNDQKTAMNIIRKSRSVKQA